MILLVSSARQSSTVPVIRAAAFFVGYVVMDRAGVRRGDEGGNDAKCGERVRRTGARTRQGRNVRREINTAAEKTAVRTTAGKTENGPS